MIKAGLIVTSYSKSRVFTAIRKMPDVKMQSELEKKAVQLALILAKVDKEFSDKYDL